MWFWHAQSFSVLCAKERRKGHALVCCVRKSVCDEVGYEQERELQGAEVEANVATKSIVCKQ